MNRIADDEYEFRTILLILRHNNIASPSMWRELAKNKLARSDMFKSCGAPLDVVIRLAQQENLSPSEYIDRVSCDSDAIAWYLADKSKEYYRTEFLPHYVTSVSCPPEDLLYYLKEQGLNLSGLITPFATLFKNGHMSFDDFDIIVDKTLGLEGGKNRIREFIYKHNSDLTNLQYAYVVSQLYNKKILELSRHQKTSFNKIFVTNNRTLFKVLGLNTNDISDFPYDKMQAIFEKTKNKALKKAIIRAAIRHEACPESIIINYFKNITYVTEQDIQLFCLAARRIDLVELNFERFINKLFSKFSNANKKRSIKVLRVGLSGIIADDELLKVLLLANEQKERKTNGEII